MLKINFVCTFVRSFVRSFVRVLDTSRGQVRESTFHIGMLSPMDIVRTDVSVSPDSVCLSHKTFAVHPPPAHLAAGRCCR